MLDGMLRLTTSKLFVHGICTRVSILSGHILIYLSIHRDTRNMVVIGAPFDDNDNSLTGSVFVYKETEDNKWELYGDKIVPADGTDDDLFGFSVDIDESSSILIGARVSL